jgi:hypothetical protein
MQKIYLITEESRLITACYNISHSIVKQSFIHIDNQGNSFGIKEYVSQNNHYEYIKREKMVGLTPLHYSVDKDNLPTYLKAAKTTISYIETRVGSYPEQTVLTFENGLRLLKIEVNQYSKGDVTLVFEDVKEVTKDIKYSLEYQAVIAQKAEIAQAVVDKKEMESKYGKS